MILYSSTQRRQEPKSCQFELQRFVNALGTVDRESGKIIQLHATLIAKPHVDTAIKKIKVANELLRKLEATRTIPEIIHILQKVPVSSLSSSAHDDLEAVIGKCLLIMEVGLA